jgi:glycosyltransferase involved in cell wall biosynthesis
MLKGYIDRADETIVSGWAWDTENPARRIVLDLCDGDQVIATIVADTLRPDLAAAAVGDGRYGFSLRLPAGLLPCAVHLLRVRFRETGADVDRSPQPVYPAHGGLDLSLEGWFSRQVEACAAAATEPKHLAPLMALCVNAMSRLLGAEARLAEGAASVPVAALDRAALPARLKQALERALQTCPPLHVPVHREPRLSIVVAGSASFAENHACIGSIVASPGLRDYEIIFVDVTAATDMVVAPFVVGGGIRFVATGKPAPAVEAYRTGLAMARGSRLLFLGHVAAVAPDAILALSETLDQRDEPVLVAPRLIGRDGRVVEAGATIAALGVRQPVGQFELQGASRLRTLRPSDDVPTRAFMVDRTVLASLGGFEGVDDFGAFGMADLAFRLRAAGGTVLVQGFADVVVSGVADDPARDAGARSRFVAAWQDALPAAQAHEAQRPRRALVVDERLPDPGRDAASVAVLSHCEALADLGFQVEFAAIERGAAMADGGRALFMRGIEVHADAGEPEALLQARAGQFDLVYLHRLSVARRLLPSLRATQAQARLVYSVADLHGLRLGREAELASDAALAGEAALLEAAERECLASADAVVTHSSHEADWIAKAVPAATVVTALWRYRLNPAPAGYATRSGFCFLGSYLHRPNVDAVRRFVAELWPQLRDSVGDATFEIAGSHFEQGGFGALPAGVVARGHVADAAAYLGRIRVMLAPLRFGAGVKGKVLLALAEGIPCVMTPVAAEGIELPEALRRLVVAADDADFIAKAAALHADPALWHEASTLGRDWASVNLSRSAIARQLSGVLGPAAG